MHSLNLSCLFFSHSRHLIQIPLSSLKIGTLPNWPCRGLGHVGFSSSNQFSARLGQCSSFGPKPASNRSQSLWPASPVSPKAWLSVGRGGASTGQLLVSIMVPRCHEDQRSDTNRTEQTVWQGIRLESIWNKFLQFKKSCSRIYLIHTCILFSSSHCVASPCLSRFASCNSPFPPFFSHFVASYLTNSGQADTDQLRTCRTTLSSHLCLAGAFAISQKES